MRAQIIAGWADGGQPFAKVQPAAWAAPTDGRIVVGTPKHFGGPTVTELGPAAIHVDAVRESRSRRQ